MKPDQVPPTLVAAHLQPEETALGQACQTLWGPHLAPDLLHFEGGGCESIWLSDPQRLLGEDNVFLAALGAENPHAALLSLCSASLAIGSVEQGCLLAHSPAGAGLCAQILVWDCEDTLDAVQGPIAWDLATGLHLLGVLRGDAQLGQAAGRYDRSAWVFAPFGRQDETPGIQASAPELGFDRIYGRLSWILMTLLDPAHIDLDVIAQLQSQSIDAQARQRMAWYAPEAVYWLWHTWLLGQHDRLQSVISEAQNNPARVVQDLIALIQAQPHARVQKVDRALAAIARVQAAIERRFPPKLRVGDAEFERADHHLPEILDTHRHQAYKHVEPAPICQDPQLRLGTHTTIHFLENGVSGVVAREPDQTRRKFLSPEAFAKNPPLVTGIYEIAANGAVHKRYLLPTVDAHQVQRVKPLSPKLLLACTSDKLLLLDRSSGQCQQEFPSCQKRTLFHGPWIIRYGGQERFSHQGQRVTELENVEWFLVNEKGRLECLRMPIPVDRIMERGDELLLACSQHEVAYIGTAPSLKSIEDRALSPWVARMR